MRTAAMLLEIDSDAVGRGFYCGVGVAITLREIDQQIALAVDVHVRRMNRHGLATIGSGRQFLNIRLDQGQRVLGDVAPVRYDESNGLAYIGDLLAGQNK